MFRRFLPLVAAVGAAALAGCAAGPPPTTEFIIATADSTYWISTDRTGVRVRGVPMTLVHYAGRFREIYTAYLDQSFDDAIFTGERLYMRDIVTNDSILVYEDSTMVRLAKRYARENPDAHPLSPTDEPPPEPTLTATTETDILDVRGPFILIERRSSIEQLGGTRSDTVRAVIDLRSAHVVSPHAVMVSTAAHDSSVITTLPSVWQRKGYDILARGDGNGGAISFVLHDQDHRSWQIMTTQPQARIYWLDTPLLDTATRHALVRAFNSAAEYDPSIKYVRYMIPIPTSPLPPPHHLVGRLIRSPRPSFRAAKAQSVLHI